MCKIDASESGTERGNCLTSWAAECLCGKWASVGSGRCVDVLDLGGQSDDVFVLDLRISRKNKPNLSRDVSLPDKWSSCSRPPCRPARAPTNGPPPLCVQPCTSSPVSSSPSSVSPRTLPALRCFLGRLCHLRACLPPLPRQRRRAHSRFRSSDLVSPSLSRSYTHPPRVSPVSTDFMFSVSSPHRTASALPPRRVRVVLRHK